MTRIGIITDVHADRHALTDALRWLDAAGVTTVLCAGDIVDYGTHPNQTITLLAQRKIPTVRGNHDRWAMSEGGDGLVLTMESETWLANLPVRHAQVIDGVRVVVVHASPRGDMDGIDARTIDGVVARRFLDDESADVMIVGHTHERFALEVRGRGWIVNAGALLRDLAPGVTSPAATGTFGVLELPACVLTVRRAHDGSVVEHWRRTVG